MKIKLTQALLHKTFIYEQESGKLIRKIQTSPRALVGMEAGYVSNNGYRIIRICGKSYVAHQLVWLYVTGKFPTKEIDHIDHDKLNNRFCNLREVSRVDNSRNLPKSKNNTSGVTGVSKGRRQGKWRAHIKVNYKYISLGEFNNKQDAINARKDAEIKYGFHKNHGVEQ